MIILSVLPKKKIYKLGVVCFSTSFNDSNILGLYNLIYTNLNMKETSTKVCDYIVKET